MTSADRHDLAKLTALGAGALFVGNLFMPWQHASVRMAGAVNLNVHTGMSGWHGWGVVAGVLALGVLGLVGARAERPRGTLLTATGMLAATALAVFAGSPDVGVMMPGLGVQVAGTRWPAWVALALAFVVTVACFEAYRTAPRTTTPRGDGVTPAAPPRPTAGGTA